MKGWKDMQKKLSLNGTLLIIPGIILMLLPLELFWSVGAWLDLVGYALMAVGLFMLHRENGGFGAADWAAAASALLCLVIPFVQLGHFGHLFGLLPLAIYCLMLYFMCTSYAALAHHTGDHHVEHHFITHMWVDIIATAAEVLAHAVGIHGILSYVILAVTIYCEAMLMLHMWRFYKKYNGFSFVINR